MANDRNWLVPLTGLAAIVIAVVGVAIIGDTPDPADDSARQIATFYQDNEGMQGLSIGLGMVVCTLLVFFGAHLRGALRAAQPDSAGDMLPAVAFAGILILVAGLAFDATLTAALVETSDDISPDAVQALSALYANDYIPFAVGISLLLLGTGISVVRYGMLPKWLGWVAILLGVVGWTPIGFATFLGGLLFIAVVSVMLALRARAGTATPRAAVAD